jgi:hypothetical protein
MRTVDKFFWRPLRLAALFFLTASLASASITDWFVRKHRDWDFVQQAGGLTVTAVQLGNGRPAAKVWFDPSGAQTITRKPESKNSALMFDQASVRVRGDEVWVKVYTVALEPGRAGSDTMVVPLPVHAHGNYRLRYENPDHSFFEMGALIVP